MMEERNTKMTITDFDFSLWEPKNLLVIFRYAQDRELMGPLSKEPIDWGGAFETALKIVTSLEEKLNEIKGKMDIAMKCLPQEGRRPVYDAYSALAREWGAIRRLLSIFESAAHYEEEQSRDEGAGDSPSMPQYVLSRGWKGQAKPYGMPSTPCKAMNRRREVRAMKEKSTADLIEAFDFSARRSKNLLIAFQHAADREAIEPVKEERVDWSGAFEMVEQMLEPLKEQIREIESSAQAVTNVLPDKKNIDDVRRACFAPRHEWYVAHRLLSILQSAAAFEEEEHYEGSDWGPGVEVAIHSMIRIEKASKALWAAVKPLQEDSTARL